MEHAVRALTLEGIRTRRIHVYRAAVEDGVVRTPRESSSTVAFGVGVGAAIGGALAIVSLVVGRGAWPAFEIVARLLGGAGAGALAGGLLALLVRRLRLGARPREPRAYDDYLLRVDVSDEVSARRIRDLLSLAGGDPLPE